MDEAVRLRPVEETDLDQLRRFSVEPDALGDYEWTGFSNHNAARRRWQDDGLLGGDDSVLAVEWSEGAGAGGAFAGVVTWRSVPLAAVPEGCWEIGVALLPEYRGRGFGAEAQRLLVDYLFDTTVAHRIQATADVENRAERRILERLGFRREGVLRGARYRAGGWHDLVLYARLRSD